MRRVVILLLVACGVFSTIGTASASGPPQHISGFAVSTLFVPTSPPRFADGNVFQDVLRQGNIFGDITGQYVQHLSTVFHPDGTIDIQGFGQVTGVIGSCGTGTVDVQVTAKFDAFAQSGVVHIQTINGGFATFDMNITGGATGVATYTAILICN